MGLPEEDYFDRGEKLEAAYALLSQMDLDVVKEADILHRMWCKFMLNVGVNQVCAAYGCPYGGVQAPGPARDAMVAAMDEARKVGACQGVLVTQKDRTAYLAVVDGLNPEALPSMAQDVLAHRKTEVEAFAGQVIQGAQDEAWRNGKILLVVDTDGRKDVERRTFSFMFEHQVEGIIGLATMYQTVR